MLAEHDYTEHNKQERKHSAPAQVNAEAAFAAAERKQEEKKRESAAAGEIQAAEADVEAHDAPPMRGEISFVDKGLEEEVEAEEVEAEDREVEVGGSLDEKHSAAPASAALSQEEEPPSAYMSSVYVDPPPSAQEQQSALWKRGSEILDVMQRKFEQFLKVMRWRIAPGPSPRSALSLSAPCLFVCFLTEKGITAPESSTTFRSKCRKM